MSKNILQKIDNLTSFNDEQKKEIKDLLCDELGIERQVGLWKPKHGEDYYYVYKEGDVDSFNYVNDRVDGLMSSFYNVCKTREQAEARIPAHKILNWLQSVKEVLCPEFRLNWNNKSQRKFHIFYCSSKKVFSPSEFLLLNYPLTVAFPSKELAQKAIDMMPDDIKELWING